MTTPTLLRNNTSDLHKATEEIMNINAIRSGALSLPGYARMMSRHHMVWNAVAVGVPPGIRPPYLGFVADVLTAITTDLDALGQPYPTASSPYSPTLATPALYGIAYVLRGSTLGAKVINRMLQDCPALHHLDRFNFFATCDNLPPRHWPDFLKELDKKVDNAAGREQALEAARGVYGLYLK